MDYRLPENSKFNLARFNKRIEKMQCAKKRGFDNLQGRIALLEVNYLDKDADLAKVAAQKDALKLENEDLWAKNNRLWNVREKLEKDLKFFKGFAWVASCAALIAFCLVGVAVMEQDENAVANKITECSAGNQR